MNCLIKRILGGLALASISFGAAAMDLTLPKGVDTSLFKDGDNKPIYSIAYDAASAGFTEHVYATFEMDVSSNIAVKIDESTVVSAGEAMTKSVDLNMTAGEVAFAVDSNVGINGNAPYIVSIEQNVAPTAVDIYITFNGVNTCSNELNCP